MQLSCAPSHEQCDPGFARATRSTSHCPLGPRRVRAHSPVGSRCLEKPKLSMPACVTLYPTQPRARTLESRLRLWSRTSDPFFLPDEMKFPFRAKTRHHAVVAAADPPRTGRVTSSRDREKTATREQKQRRAGREAKKRKQNSSKRMAGREAADSAVFAHNRPRDGSRGEL